MNVEGSVTQDSGESLGKNKKREDGKKEESGLDSKRKREGDELAPLPHMLAPLRSHVRT